MSLVFLDFDGVLFDTLKEAFVLSRYAFNNINIFDEIDEDMYRRFFRYKFLVYNSWQYYYLMKILSEGKILYEGAKTDEEFITKYKFYIDNRDKKSEMEFDEKYLKKRIELMNEHGKYWNSMEKPFDFFYEIKKLFEDNKIDIVIVSKKNKVAIKKRLSEYGLGLGDDKIFAKEELVPYPTKIEFIADYMEKNGINNAFFVDDNSNNFAESNNHPNITTLLAGWGNIGFNETGLMCGEVIKKIIKQ